MGWRIRVEFSGDDHLYVPAAIEVRDIAAFAGRFCG
jgi:hypothetical protein